MIVALVIFLIFIAVFGVGVLFGAPFLPTRKKWVDDALTLANVGSKDVVVDLGSGNGVVLRQALKKGAKKVVGYEINPLLVILSRLRLKKFGWRAKIIDRDFFKVDLPPETTVIYLFPVERVVKRLPDFLEQQRPRLKAKEIRLVVFSYPVPGIKPTKTLNGMSLYEI